MSTVNIMYRFTFIFLVLVSMACPATAGTYLGNKMLEVLGEDKNSESVSEFKTQFLLDKAYKNAELGIKLTTDHEAVSSVTAITVTAAGYEINDIKYKQFEGALPFNISLNDDGDALEQKFGTVKTGDQEARMKFKKDGITVNVYFKSANRKKISYIKFTQNVGMTGPYRLDGNHEVPVMTASTAEAIPLHSITDNIKTAVKPAKPAPDRNITALPSAAEFSKSAPSNTRVSQDPFYASIMNVIESGEEEMFKDIKKEAKAKTNFWNYKYTYSTSVSIPGEKYNMLYSFPFQNSQLDFVSVLEETDGENPAISAKYAEIEGKLKNYFKLTEGWSYHYTVNPEDPKGIKDLELKNPKLGSIVLDYSINPYGKHVLYLRFLLQYT